MADMDPEQLIERILGNVFADYAPLESALIKIFGRIPQTDADVLIYERDVWFILPVYCFAYPLFLTLPANLDKPEGRFRWLVILRTDLLDEPESHQIYTITHELAHVFLEHTPRTFEEFDEVASLEKEADEQVIKWGFEKELRGCTYNYLFGSGGK